MFEESDQSILTTKIQVHENAAASFREWQAKLHSELALFKGFLSLEIVSPSPPQKPEWTIIQRFDQVESLGMWRQSAVRKRLWDELTPYLEPNIKAIQEKIEVAPQEGVTEVFVTYISSDKIQAYRDWIGKMHSAEAKFQGFQRVYVQSPREGAEGPWITLLQFDTVSNLDRWLGSSERQRLLQEGQSMMLSLENQRVYSAFAGWFSNLTETPPVWKQTMLVLLVLFPVVMLELHFLNPFTSSLNPAIATFIGNAISVILISWPLMPISIYFLKWWLTPCAKHSKQITLKGVFLICLLYVAEIALLWN